MSNPNFVSDLVAMAKAFEELPIIQVALQQSEKVRSEQAETIQRLELRLMDLKEELTLAHQATRKVEVERDHAERMFLETDDRLNAFRRLVQAFDTDVKSLVQAAEPEPKPEPEVKPIDEHGQVNYQPEPGPAVGDAFTLGQGDADPTASTDSAFASPNVSTQPVETQTTASSDTEAVSVQPDPTPATPDAQHSPAGSSASAGESNATTETAGSMQHEEVTPSVVDPTASSTAGDGHSPETVEATSSAEHSADANTGTSSSPSVDDVGYHNEPKIGPAGGPEAWHEWDIWCSRMNRKYGGGSWPARLVLHGGREAASQ